MPDWQQRKLIVLLIAEELLFLTDCRGAFLPDWQQRKLIVLLIAEEQCAKWSENPDSFVEDEDEDTFAYSVRISSQVNVFLKIFLILLST